MAKVLDWSASSDKLRKKLLGLSRKKLIKACKHKKVKYKKKYDKLEMVNQIMHKIDKQRSTTEPSNVSLTSSPSQSITANVIFEISDNTDIETPDIDYSTQLPMDETCTNNTNNYAKYDKHYWIKPSNMQTFKPSVSVVQHYQQNMYVNEANCQWLPLEPAPFARFNEIIAINESEFIVAPTNDADCTYETPVNGIQSYNIYENKWIKLIDYPPNLKKVYHTIAYNAQSHILYCYDSSRKLILINLANNTHQIIWNYINKSKAGMGAKGMIINHKFHLIGGYNNHKHLIFNDETMVFDTFEVEVFKQYKDGFDSFQLVYVKCKRIVLLFGGYRFDKEQNMNSIYSYSILDNEWSKVECALPNNILSYSFGVVSNASGGRYIVLFGGERKSIFVYDTETVLFYKSSVEYPSQTIGSVRVTVMEDYLYSILLIYGYLRDGKLNRLPSTDVIKIIAAMYAMQYLHLIIGDQHWKMDLRHIINSVPFCSDKHLR